MPNIDVYLPEDVYVKLRTAAQSFRLTHKQFARAILCAAVSELERADGRILPGDAPSAGTGVPAPPRQPVREGGAP